jgi:heme-degrading monooxygenase HmoA
MIFVSLTRLRVRSIFSMVPFLFMTERAVTQIIRSPGFLGGRILVDRRRTFWTATIWESEAAMKGYRGSGAHREAMPKLAGWCDEAAIAHWSQESPEIPDWRELWQRLSQNPRMSAVKRPSEAHIAKRFAEPRTTIGRTIKRA